MDILGHFMSTIIKNNKSSRLIVNFVMILVFVLIFSYLFYQNILFTDSFEVYNIRSLDGMSFHVPLQKIHEYFVNIKLDYLFKDSYYFGYNWLFWL